MTVNGNYETIVYEWTLKNGRPRLKSQSERFATEEDARAALTGKQFYTAKIWFKGVMPVARIKGTQPDRCGL